MNEYDQTAAALYDYYSLGVEGDVQFYIEEAQKAGSSVLEIGCGTGRILLPVAQSGISIVGLDRASDPVIRTRRRLAQAPRACDGKESVCAATNV